MTTTEKKTVELNVQGVEWPLTLTYDFNQIAEAEAVCGVNLLTAVNVPSRMSAAQLRGLLYALLRPTNEKLELTDVGDILTTDAHAAQVAVIDCLGFDVAVPADDSFFRSLEKMAIERPIELVEMLKLVKLAIPEPPPESIPQQEV